MKQKKTPQYSPIPRPQPKSLPPEQRFIVRDLKLTEEPEHEGGLEFWIAGVRLDPSPAALFAETKLTTQVDLLPSNIRGGMETRLIISGGSIHQRRILAASFIDNQATPDQQEGKPTIRLKDKLFAVTNVPR